MKTNILFLIGVILSSVFTIITPVMGSENPIEIKSHSLSNDNKDPIVEGMQIKVLEERVRSKVLLDVDSKSAELIADGIEAIDLTREAILLIQKKNKPAAIELIGRAIGKLETVQLRNPQMTLVPIHRVIRTNDLDTNLGAIKIIKKNIFEALDQNKFHIARKELESLISEVRVETTNIPIGSYPSALRNALLLVEKGDFDTASIDLSTLLNTLVLSEEHMSLPCLRAEVLLEEANTLQPGHKDPIANRKMLLKSAISQIDIAFELGQIERNSLKEITDRINGAINVLGTSNFKEELEQAISSIKSAKNTYGIVK